MQWPILWKIFFVFFTFPFHSKWHGLIETPPCTLTFTFLYFAYAFTYVYAFTLQVFISLNNKSRIVHIIVNERLFSIGNKMRINCNAFNTLEIPFLSVL